MRNTLLTVLLILSTSLVSAADNWPQFRGPGGDGQSDAVGLPVTWSETENITWKTPIHGRGWSSPVVWGDQIWLTTATDDGHDMFAVCVDRESGKIIHDLHLLHNDELQEIHSLNSFASPTPVIEEGRVYVHFGVYGTACLDTESGKVLWMRRNVCCDHFRGPGSSPILYRDLLIFHMDGIDVQFVTALDKRTGKTVWRTDRSPDLQDVDPDLRKAYSTPLLVEVDGREQIVCTGAMDTVAYHPATGEALWWVRHGGYSNTSRPVFGHGLVLINSGFGRSAIWAVRPDGRGDVTESHVAWKFNRGVPVKPSPVLVDDLLYMASDNGIVSCVEAKAGQLVWQERLDGEYSASPIHVDGRIYFFSHDDNATVIRAGRRYEKLATNKLDAGFMASPAVSGKALFLRTKTHLYRVEQ